MRERFATLRSRVALTIVVSLVPALAFVAYFASLRRTEALKAHADRAALLARGAADRQHTTFEIVRSDLELLCDVRCIRDHEAAASTELLAKALRRRAFLANIALLDAEGRLVATAVPTPGPTDFAGHPVVARALAERRFVIGRHEMGPISRRPVMATALPVLDADGRPSAVLVASIAAESFDDPKSRDESDPPTVFAVMDRQGTILARYPRAEGLVGRPVDPETWAKGLRALAADESFVYVGIDGVERTFALASPPYPDAPVVAVGIPTAIAAADGRRALVEGLVFVLAFAAVSLALASWISHPLIFRDYRPILAAVRRFAEGDLTARARLAGAGELAELGRAYDAGAERIDALTRERETTGRRLQALARRLQRVRDDEQTRIAREIHDEFGQELTALRMDVQAVRQDVAGDEAIRARVDHLLGEVDGLFALVRRIASELRPPLLDDLGLVDATRRHVGEFAKAAGVRAEVRAPDDLPGIDPAVALSAFRILQEALTNVARHAAASSVVVRLASEGDDLVLEVADDGRGFAPEAAARGASLGVLGMGERAAAFNGTLTVDSQTGRGTRVLLRLPRRRGTA